METFERIMNYSLFIWLITLGIILILFLPEIKSRLYTKVNKLRLKK
jgi:hypothetical protein